MKTQLLFLAVLVCNLTFGANILYDKNILLPEGEQPEGRLLDSITIVEHEQNIRYILVPSYAPNGAINGYASDKVLFDGELAENTSLNFRFVGKGDRVKSVLLNVVEGAQIVYEDSTVIYFDEKGQQVREERFVKRDGVYVGDAAVVWSRPKGDDGIAVDEKNDTTVYRAINSQIQEILTIRSGQYDKVKYTYDENGLLKSAVRLALRDKATTKKMELLYHYEPMITSAATVNAPSYHVYPNPGSAHIVVNSNYACNIEIYTMTGQKVKGVRANCNEVINLVGLKSGYYLLVFHDAFGQRQSKKVLVQ